MWNFKYSLIKVGRDENESVEEWIGHLRFKANECNYKKHDWQLKEQFITQINEKMLITKIEKELTTMQNTSNIMSKQVLS